MLFLVILMNVMKSLSLHAGSGNENEQLKELLALMKEDLAPAEKMYVRKSIERHKLGTNKTALQQVQSKWLGWESNLLLCLTCEAQQMENRNPLWH